MKSSCSARGLSASQNLPEIALILSVSLSLRPSLTLFNLIHPSTPTLSLHFTLLICIQLSLSPSPLPSMSSADSFSASVCFPLLLFAISMNLLCNCHYFCQHLFLMSPFLTFYSVVLAMYSMTLYLCLSSLLHYVPHYLTSSQICVLQFLIFLNSTLLLLYYFIVFILFYRTLRIFATDPQGKNPISTTLLPLSLTHYVCYPVSLLPPVFQIYLQYKLSFLLFANSNTKKKNKLIMEMIRVSIEDLMSKLTAANG